MSEDALDALDFVDDTARRSLRHLGKKLITGDVVLFAGAGLSRNAQTADGSANHMPTWEGLASAFLRELDEETRRDADPLKAADYYETTYGRPALATLVQRLIADGRHEPGRVHRTIAELNLREIITTNYDTLLERAFTSLHLQAQTVVTGADLVERRSPRIIKMNGCINRNPMEIVITTDDFLGYPAREPLIEAVVLRSFVESRVLFVGFGLNDPTFRAINQRVRWLLGEQCPLSYSLQLRATETEVRYWRNHKVELIPIGSPGKERVDYEDRLHRVLRALLAIQRSETAFPEPMPRASVAPAHGEPEPARIAAAVLLVAPGLNRADVEQELAKNAALTSLLGNVYAGTGETAAECDAATLAFLRDAVGLGSDAPISADEPEAQAIRQFAELILAGEPCGEVASLALLLLMQAVAAGAGDGLQSEARLIRAAGRLSTTLPENMAVRARHLLLLLLFAPLDAIGAIVTEWDRGTERNPTHDEYRIALQAFFGIPQDRPALIANAAESLWARQLSSLEAGERPRVRSDAMLRYFHLLRFARRHAPAWEGWATHSERLTRVGGVSALFETTGSTSTGAEALRELIDDLEHGWLCDSPSRPRGLGRAWTFARTACALGNIGGVGLTTLIAASLICDGASLIDANQALLVQAWQLGAVDPCLLLEHIATRVGRAQFTALSSHSHPIAKCERGLAILARWVFDQIDEEEPDSPLRTDAARIFTPALAEWLPRTGVAPAREHLLHILTTLVRWGGGFGRDIVRKWIASRLDGGGKDVRARLADLSTAAGEPLLDPQQTRLLLARAAGDGSFQRDIEEWLFRWADHPSIDDRLVRDLAADVVGWFESEVRTFEWIARAARARTSARLTTAIVGLQPVQTFGTLGGYVVGRLQTLKEQQVELWKFKRNAFFGILACLASDFALADRAALREMVLAGELTPDGRDGAAILAARMLEQDNGGVADAPEWLAVLAQMLEDGATGCGQLRTSIGRLSKAQSRRLQTNLLTTLARRKDIPNADVVEWIGCTVTDARDIVLDDLESELCRLLLADERPYALAAASVLMRIRCERPEVIDRNADRILRARAVLTGRETNGRFRPTSAFMRNVETLATAAAGITAAQPH